jgi:outer membrane protein OmpA-like peptidoglycan-associated protein
MNPLITSRRARKNSASDASKPENIFSENAAKIVTRMMFAIGVFSLFSYFFHIEYFPSFDLKSVTSYATSLAYVLTILVISLSFAFLIPYVISATFIRAKPNKRGNKKLIVEILAWAVYGMLSMSGISASIFFCLDQQWPFEVGIILGFLFLILLSSIRVNLIRYRNKAKSKYVPTPRRRRKIMFVKKSNIVWGAFWRGQLIVSPKIASPSSGTQKLSRNRIFSRQIGRLLLVGYSRANPSHADRLWERRTVRRILWAQWWGTLITGIMQLIPLSFLILTLAKASEIRTDDYSSHIMIAAEYAMCVAMTGGILLYLSLSPAYRNNWQWGLLLILFLPLVLSLFSQSAGMLPMAVMQFTKNGNFRAEKMILSPNSCNSIAPILGIDCDSKSSKFVELCNVQVMTRVGPETYLRLPERVASKDGKRRVQRLFIQTADIAAMDIDFDVKFFRLKALDENLSKLSQECLPHLTTLYGDSVFNFDGFSLSELGRKDLIRFVQNIQGSAKSIKEIVITGYADHIGTESYNAWLSHRRADEVRLSIENELKGKEISVPLRVESKGSANAKIIDCSKAKDKVACEAPNRRVEIQIVKTDNAETSSARQ